MKNTKEVKAILTALYCINYTNGNKDIDIQRILEYAFKRLFGSNTNLLTICCIGKDKNAIMPEVMDVLKVETKYIK